MTFNFTPETADGVQLAALSPGEGGTVLAVDGTDPAGRRLLDLGFIPGTEVLVIRRAPLRDPTVYQLRGSRICLRRAEAARIRVAPGEPAVSGP